MFANVTFRAKLLAVVAAPVVVMGGLGWLVVSPRLDEARAAAATLRASELVDSSLRVVADVADEREAAVAQLSGRGDLAALTKARVRVDNSLATLGTSTVESEGPLLSGAVADALDASQRITALRRAVDNATMSPQEAFSGYAGISERLTRLGSGVSARSGNSDLIRRSQSLVVFMQALDRTTELRGDVAMRLGAGQFDDRAVGRAGALREHADRLLDQFETASVPPDRDRYRDAMSAPDVAAGSAVIDQVLSDTAAESGVGPDAWSAAMSQRVRALGAVQSSVSAGLRDAAASAAREARSASWWTIAMALAAAALSVVASGMLSRSMSRRLHDISDQAADIASNQLPAVLAATRSAVDDDVVDSLPLVRTDGRDEVGQLAESFNRVLAASVSSSLEHARHQHEVVTNLLTSLGRRNQSIIERQLDIIDGLESRYSEPELLEHLFRLDHLATGLRRNAENLLILGADVSPRAWREPVAMFDVVRSAASEIEDLDRVEVFVDTDGVPLVQGRAAVDLSHLLAELVDNAAAFSPPGAPVTVTGRVVEAGFEVIVTDQGIGMTDEAIREINHRLAAPSALDDIVADRVGFQVVSRLATRLSASVSLAERDRRGMSATVIVPNAVLDFDSLSPIAPFVAVPVIDGNAGSAFDGSAAFEPSTAVPDRAPSPFDTFDPFNVEIDQPVLPAGAVAPQAVPVPVPAPAPVATLAPAAFAPAPSIDGWAGSPFTEASAEPAAEPNAELAAAMHAAMPPEADSGGRTSASPPQSAAFAPTALSGLVRREPGRALDDSFDGSGVTPFQRLPVPASEVVTSADEDQLAAARRHALSRHSTGVARGRSLFVRSEQGVPAADAVAWHPLGDGAEAVVEGTAGNVSRHMSQEVGS